MAAAQELMLGEALPPLLLAFKVPEPVTLDPAHGSRRVGTLPAVQRAHAASLLEGFATRLLPAVKGMYNLPARK